MEKPDAMPAGRQVSIIIVSYKTKNELVACLNSIYRNTKNIGFEIIVVDNNSQDSTVQMIEEKFPQVELIKNDRNLGFARAVNQGVKIAKARFLFILNPDTKFIDNSLKILVDFARKHNEGIIVPKLLNPDLSSQKSVRRLPTIVGAIKEYWLGIKNSYDFYLPASKNPIEVECVTGAAMLIPKTIFAKLAGFNEHYFLYYEDLDFCHRVKQNGYKITYLPQAKIIHAVGAAGKDLKNKAYQYLKASSRIYHGTLVSLILNLILFLGQKWQKIFLKNIQII